MGYCFRALPRYWIASDCRQGCSKGEAGLLSPLIKVIGQLRKIFLTPMARYWLKPCCENIEHHTNYSLNNNLPALGSNIFRLGEHIWYALFTRRTSNFRVLCPHRMLARALCWKIKRLRRSVLSGKGMLFTLFRLPTKSWLPPSRMMSPTLGPGTSTLRNSMEAPPQKNKN
jgi:hypothetical protein